MVLAPPEPGGPGEEDTCRDALTLAAIGIALLYDGGITDGGAPPKPDADGDDTG